MLEKHTIWNVTFNEYLTMCNINDHYLYRYIHQSWNKKNDLAMIKDWW